MILLGLLAAAALPFVPDAGAGGSACSRFGPMARVGALTDPGLVELSGLAASRRHSGVLWAHNDSGGAAEVFAMGLDGKARGVFPVTGAEAVDWEDMAVGPGPGSGSYLYLGDIGDNGAERSMVTVYRVPEPAGAPSAPGAPLGGMQWIHLKYPTGPADAEALLVDPRSGELVIVTKALSGTSRIFSASAASLQGGATVTMVSRGTIKIPVPSGGSGLPGTMVTGGDVSPDGSTVALRTYRSVLVYPRGGSGSVVDALKRTACFGPQAQEPQGESVAFTRDGASLVTISEGSKAPVYRSGKPAAATTTTTARPTPTTAGAGGSGGGSDGGSDGGGGGGTTTTGDATTTTEDSSTTTERSTTATGEDGADDDRDDGEGGGDEAAGEAAGEAASSEEDDDGVSPLVLLVPVVVIGGAGGLVWLRRRRSAVG